VTAPSRWFLKIARTDLWLGLLDRARCRGEATRLESSPPLKLFMRIVPAVMISAAIRLLHKENPWQKS